MIQYLTDFYNWITDFDHWRLITGAFSMIGTGVGLWVGYRVNLLRKDYQLGTRLRDHLKVISGVRSEWNRFSGTNFDQKAVHELAAKLKTRITTLIVVASPEIKKASKAVRAAVLGKRNPWTLWLTRYEVVVTPDYINQVWLRIVDLDEILKEEKQERINRPV